MKELTDDITVSIICNKKYLKAANGDKLKAEKMCNKDIINLISILDGNIIIPFRQTKIVGNKGKNKSFL